MGFVEIVPHVRQVLSGNAQVVHVVEVAGREDEFLPRDRLAAKTCFDLMGGNEFGVRPDSDALGSHHTAVVLERLFPRRLGAGADKRMAADLEPFGRREEGHVDRITDDRIGDRARVDDERVEAAAFGGDGAGQADRPGAGDDGGHYLGFACARSSSSRTALRRSDLSGWLRVCLGMTLIYAVLVAAQAQAAAAGWEAAVDSLAKRDQFSGV